MKKQIKKLMIILLVISLMQIPVFAEVGNTPPVVTETPSIEPTESPESTVEPEGTPIPEITPTPEATEIPIVPGTPETIEIPLEQNPPTTMVNSSISMKIVNGDGTEWDGMSWANNELKTAEVTVDFGDATSSGKRVEFSVPDGMMYNNIPVPNSYVPERGVDTGKLLYLSGSDPLSAAITKVVVSKAEVVYGRQTYGKVIYDFLPGTERVKLSFNIAVDKYKYYGPHNIKDKIIAEAFKETTSFGKIEQDVYVTGKPSAWGNIDSIQQSFLRYRKGTEKILASKGDEVSVATTGHYTLTGTIGEPRYKHVKVTMYYPKEMEIKGIYIWDNNNLINNDKLTIAINESEGKVDIEYNPSVINSSGRWNIQYIVPEGTPVGIYKAGGIPTAEITTYDGTVFTNVVATSDGKNPAEIDSIEVMDSFGETMSMSAGGSIYNDSSESYIGRVGFENTLGRRQNNIMYNVIVDPDFDVYEFRIPYDKTIAGNNVTNVQYKTNLNSSYRTYTGELSTYSAWIFYVKKFTKEDAGLQEGEWFTELLVNVGSASPNYSSLYTNGEGPDVRLLYGKVKEGVARTLETELNVWIEGKKDTTFASKKSTSKMSLESNAVSSESKMEFYNSDGKVVTKANAGDAIKIKGDIKVVAAVWGRNLIVNPEIYIIENENLIIDEKSIVLTDQDNQPVVYDLEERTLNSGKKVIVLKTKDSKIAVYSGYPGKQYRFNLSYNATISSKIESDTKLDTRDMIAWGDKKTLSIGQNAYVDIYDVNDNGLNEIIPGVQSVKLAIPKSEKVSVETFMAIPGEEPKAYIEGNDKTVSYFTPGTEAEYIFRIENMSTEPSSEFALFAPIPKEGQNFGAEYQNAAFKWNMKVAGIPVVSDPTKFDVFYSATANQSTIETDTGYSAIAPSLEDINAIKFKMIQPLQPGEKVEIRIPLGIDETYDSANNGNKIGTRNIFNPRFSMKSTSFTGTLKATKVGTELVIAEIGGRMFEDSNLNGLYETGEPTFSNEFIKLYKYDAATGSYVQAVDKQGFVVTTTTNDQGEYQFDYTKNVGYGDYAVEFPNKAGYEFTKMNVGSNEELDSDAQMTGTQRGWVVGIDGIVPDGKQQSAGLVQYTATDITEDMADSYSVKKNKSITMPVKLVNKLHENFITSYQWSLKVPSDSQYVNLSGTKTLIVDGLKETPINYDVVMVLTITDIYGNIKNFEFTTKVTSNDAPVITVSHGVVSVSEGAIWDAKAAVYVSVADKEDGIIPNSKISVSNDIPTAAGKASTPGTYELTYSVKDSDNNTVTKKMKVKVEGLPYLTDKSDVQLDMNALPVRELRLEESHPKFGTVKVKYMKPSETVGGTLVETEINPLGDASQGEADAKLENGSGQVVNGPDSVGRYSIKYTLKNPSQGTVHATQSLDVRGEVSTTSEHISYAGTNLVKSYASWDEFYTIYENELNVETSIKIVNDMGTVETKDLKSTMVYAGSTAFDQIMFELPSGQQTKVITLPMKITDNGDGKIAAKEYIFNILVTIMEVVGERPVITFNHVDTNRIIGDAAMDGNVDVLANRDDTDRVIYKKLMNDAAISDPDGTITASGIESIEKMMRTPIDMVDVTSEDALAAMLNGLGVYKLTYYAEDNDGNRWTEEKRIHVAGPTVFVQAIGSPNDVPLDDFLEFREAEGDYTGVPVEAYHLDPDGTKHAMPVDPRGSVDLTIVGKTQLTYETTHHYVSLPDSTILREKDKVVQEFKIQGNIEFDENSLPEEENFVDETVNLGGVKASFDLVLDNGTVEETAATITTNQGGSDISSTTPTEILVTYTATDTVSGAPDNVKTLDQTVSFYGLPEIVTLTDSLTVKEDELKTTIEGLIGGSGKITLADGTEDTTLVVIYDYTSFDEKLGGTVKVSTTYTLGNDKTRTAEKDITITVVQKPEITASDFEEVIGTEIDLMNQLRILVVVHTGTYDPTKITITHSIPVDANNLATTKGTYPVEISYEDDVHNISTKTVFVKINGIPTLGIQDTKVKVGTTFEEALSKMNLVLSQGKYDGTTEILDNNLVQIDSSNYNPNQLGEVEIEFKYEYVVNGVTESIIEIGTITIEKEAGNNGGGEKPEPERTCQDDGYPAGWTWNGNACVGPDNKPDGGNNGGVNVRPRPIIKPTAKPTPEVNATPEASATPEVSVAPSATPTPEVENPEYGKPGEKEGHLHMPLGISLGMIWILGGILLYRGKRKAEK